MEPLGTIKMHFPHVDEETRSILVAIMEEADNFADFLERSYQRVMSESTSILLEYLTVFFLLRTEKWNLIDRLVQAGKVPSLAEPFVLCINSQRGSDVTWKNMSDSLQKAINEVPNDWFATHLYLNWRRLVEFIYTETDVDVKPIEIITSNVNNNKDLEIFKSNLLLLQADVQRRDRQVSDALVNLREALDIAKKFDDQLFVAEIQLNIADRLKLTDLKSAMDLLHSTIHQYEKLGFGKRPSLLTVLGRVMTFRGEVNAGIEYIKEDASLRESNDLPIWVQNQVIAFFYNQIGDGERALEIIDELKPMFIQRSSAWCHLMSAWALYNLGKYNDAKDEFTIAQELALKSGRSEHILVNRIVEGLMDRADSKLRAAAECFEDVLRFLKQEPSPMFENICLLNLTEIEIEMMDDEVLVKDSEMSGPWMHKLFEHAKVKNLPGITARGKILMALLRQKQQRYDEMSKILEDVQETANKSSSMRYLNRLVNERFPEYITEKVQRRD